MTKVEKAVQWAVGIANDNTHGYDQTHRWGTDYDCSSLVISAFKQAGIPVGAATYTGNMFRVFCSNGFSVVRDGSLKRGDVLLNVRHHTALYIGNNQIVQASINEKGTVSGGQPGDQTGNEISIRPYYNFPWDYVLRYTEDEEDEPVERWLCTPELPMLKHGDMNGAVLALQVILVHKWGVSVGSCGCDGEFGNDTENAVRSFQAWKELDSDGIVGVNTWAALIGGHK